MKILILFLVTSFLVTSASEAQTQYTPPCYSGGAPCNGTNAPTFPPYIAGSILLNPPPNYNSTYYGTQFGQISPYAPNDYVLSILNNKFVVGPLPAAPGGVSCNGAPTSSFASVNGYVTHC